MNIVLNRHKIPASFIHLFLEQECLTQRAFEKAFHGPVSIVAIPPFHKGLVQMVERHRETLRGIDVSIVEIPDNMHFVIIQVSGSDRILYSDAGIFNHDGELMSIVIPK